MNSTINSRRSISDRAIYTKQLRIKPIKNIVKTNNSKYIILGVSVPVGVDITNLTLTGLMDLCDGIEYCEFQNDSYETFETAIESSGEINYSRNWLITGYSNTRQSDMKELMLMDSEYIKFDKVNIKRYHKYNLFIDILCIDNIVYGRRILSTNSYEEMFSKLYNLSTLGAYYNLFDEEGNYVETSEFIEMRKIARKINNAILTQKFKELK